MQKYDPLVPEYFYHIYNRGNNRENIFFEKANYLYFLELLTKYILPIADIFAYCLLRNHFHFLLRLKALVSETFEVSETSKVSKYYSQKFSNFFNAYAKAINKRYGRSGSLFQTRFGRKIVTTEEYLINMIHYIHFNPQKHGFIDNFREYPFSSYHALITERPTKIARDEVIKIFGDKAGFIEFHDQENDFGLIRGLVEEDVF